MVGVNTDTGEVMRLYFKDSIALRSIAPEDMPTGQDWGMIISSSVTIWMSLRLMRRSWSRWAFCIW